jgi:hypothetical protein
MCKIYLNGKESNGTNKLKTGERQVKLQGQPAQRWRMKAKRGRM